MDEINKRKFSDKKVIISFGILLLLLLLLSFYLLKKSFAFYNSNASLDLNIDQALYVLGQEKMSFNIDSSKIIPSDTPYVYKFSISNYNEVEHCDFDIEYDLKIKTTTNLPITFELYKNENSTVNLLKDVVIQQDADGSWYRIYNIKEKEAMMYLNDVKNVYTLKINFPSIYSKDTTYADSLECIEILVNSTQII